MTWVKLDDKMLSHPRIALVGGLGFAVHVAGIIYCGQHLTDGFVPRGAIGFLLNLDGVGLVEKMYGDDATVLAIIERGQPGSLSLEEAALWEWDDARNGWLIRDYLDYNPSRSEVLRGRAADAARKRSEQGKSSGRNPSGGRRKSTQSAPENDVANANMRVSQADQRARIGRRNGPKTQPDLHVSSGRNPSGVRTDSNAPVPVPEPDIHRTPSSSSSQSRVRFAEEEAEVVSISTALRGGAA